MSKAFQHLSSWGKFWRILTWIRWTLMLALAAGAFRLVEWSRARDPRFYHFLGTQPGRLLARVMKWPTLHNLPRTDKPESEFTDEELAIKRKLEAQLQAAWPTHEVQLANGRRILGRLQREEADAYWVREAYGNQGDALIRLAREQVAGIRPRSLPLPRITWRDVRFQMEYPAFHLHHQAHYTVLTDAPYFQVADSVRELERLYGQYERLMGPLIQHEKRAEGIQVLFFTRESDYRKHQEAYAPKLADSAGFYSPLQDRMVVFNQNHSERATLAKDQVRGQIRAMLQEARSPADRSRILALQASVESRLRRQADQETDATLRHEGAHHLSYTLGVHSAFHVENAWIIEGLAVYFEPSEPGDLPLGHMYTLMRLNEEGRGVGLRDLVSIRDPDLLQSLAPAVDVNEAYALSWSLFHFCMLPERRPLFFDYLRFIRDPGNIDVVVRTPAADLLASHLGMDADALEHAWILHLRSL